MSKHVEVNGIRAYRGTDGVLRVSDGHEFRMLLPEAKQFAIDLDLVLAKADEQIGLGTL